MVTLPLQCPLSLSCFCLAQVHGCQRIYLVSVRSQPRAIEEVAALVALRSGIVHPPESIVGTVGAKMVTPWWSPVPSLLHARLAFCPLCFQGQPHTPFLGIILLLGYSYTPLLDWYP